MIFLCFEVMEWMYIRVVDPNDCCPLASISLPWQIGCLPTVSNNSRWEGLLCHWLCLPQVGIWLGSCLSRRHINEGIDVTKRYRCSWRITFQKTDCTNNWQLLSMRVILKLNRGSYVHDIRHNFLKICAQWPHYGDIIYSGKICWDLAVSVE